MNQNTYATPTNLRYWKMCEDLIDGGGHLLIGGRTGSGKSVVINDYLYSITAKRTPRGARFVLIDPKKVELEAWRSTPFCWIYADEQDTIIKALDAVICEMENRYRQMKPYHLKMFNGGEIWVVVDELGDLMTTCRRDFLPRLQKILNLGRAARINVIMGTQSPSRKTIPAEIQLNTTHLLALNCRSAIESKQIVGIPGAEALPRYGVGIMQTPAGLQYISIPMTSEEAIAERIRVWQLARPQEPQRGQTQGWLRRMFS